jgi:hypothetical protein
MVMVGIYYKNSINRRENLNIIRDDNKVYFYLSDDYFFSVDLEKNRKIGEIIVQAINNEMDYIKTGVRRIRFINFENKPLENLLNSMIELKRG